MLPDEVHETNIDTVPHLVQWDRPGRPWSREPVSVMGKTTGVYFCKEGDFLYNTSKERETAMHCAR